MAFTCSSFQQLVLILEFMDFSGVCSQVPLVDRLICLCLLWDETIFPVAEIIFAFLDLRESV